jgi:hypothetical protein
MAKLIYTAITSLDPSVRNRRAYPWIVLAPGSRRIRSIVFFTGE